MFDSEKRREPYDDDDGHVIANMNVEGMPWYRKEEKWHVKSRKPSEFTREETRYIILGTIRAALAIAGAFLGGLFLVILLMCIVSWLRY